MDLWSKEVEKKFFKDSFRFASPEQVFYVSNDKRYLAYWPKSYKGTKSTLQSRNSLIGKFTEKWTADLIRETISDKKLFAVQGARCEEIALTDMSPADVVIYKNKICNPETTKLMNRDNCEK